MIYEKGRSRLIVDVHKEGSAYVRMDFDSCGLGMIIDDEAALLDAATVFLTAWRRRRLAARIEAGTDSRPDYNHLRYQGRQ